ncbi:MAG: flavin reductase family protein [Planctomycetes bacterium]|nr:flavin reductase family protein [Planctomycetota bacterium]
MKPADAEKHLAAALGRVASGLFILTYANGRVETGLLASWVQQCSFQPPRISVAVKPGREIAGLLAPGTAFTLNILEDGQTDMIAHFGKGFSSSENAFAGLEVERGGPGGPILVESLAVLECQVVDRFPAGDHDLFVAEVNGGKMLDEGHPMVHIRKNGFHY